MKIDSRNDAVGEVDQLVCGVQKRYVLLLVVCVAYFGCVDELDC